MYLQLQSTMTRPPSRRSVPDSPPQAVPTARSRAEPESPPEAGRLGSCREATFRPDPLSTSQAAARAQVRSSSPPDSLPRRQAPAYNTVLPDSYNARPASNRLGSSPPEPDTRKQQGSRETAGRRQSSSKRSPDVPPDSSRRGLSDKTHSRGGPDVRRRRRTSSLGSSPKDAPRRRTSGRNPPLNDEQQQGRRRSSHSLPEDMPPRTIAVRRNSKTAHHVTNNDEQGRRRCSHFLPEDDGGSGSRRRSSDGRRRSSASRTTSPSREQRKRASVRTAPPKGPPKSPPQSTRDVTQNGLSRSSLSHMSSTTDTTSQSSLDQHYEPMSAVYRHARKHEWDAMLNHCRLYPREAMYVHPMDGTTALHVAVMSRTGYSPPVHPTEDGQMVEPKVPCPAPMEVIEELLLLCPEASRVVCKINSYTPLAYACLVSGEEWNLEDSAAMVRLFLQHARDSLSIFTEGGLSALDVHIISFSYKKREQQAEDNVMSGRTSTVVLRTLLEADPCLAHVRIRKDKVGGPIELLYRCNSGAFLDAVDLDDKSYMKKTRAENDKSVIGTIKDWWVWKWTVLLLKYGTVPYKKKGAPFLTVQAAAGMVGCPLPVLTLAIRAFPKQIRQPDEMQGNTLNLPLHQVSTWPCQQDSESMDPVISSRKGMAISALLQEYPDAAKITNNLNQTPLELAVATGTTWDGGVRKLVRANPQAVSIPSPSTRLPPFLAAAEAAGASSQDQPPTSTSRRSVTVHMKAIAKRDLQSVRTIYGLLRADPMVLTKLYCHDYDDCA